MSHQARLFEVRFNLDLKCHLIETLLAYYHSRSIDGEDFQLHVFDATQGKKDIIIHDSINVKTKVK